MRNRIPFLKKRAASAPDRSGSPRYSDKALSLVAKADQQYRAGRLQEARASLRAARRTDADLSMTYLMEAQIARDLDDPKENIRLLRVAVSADSRSSKTQNRAGQLLVQAGRFDVGIKALKRAVAISPQDPQFAQDLAAVYLSRNRKDLAVDVLTEAIRRNPREKSLAIACAQLHESDGNWKSALVFFKMALRDQPEDRMLRRKYARCLYHLKDYKQAALAFADCVDVDDSTLPLTVAVEYGDACLQFGDYRRAQQIFDGVSQRAAVPLKDIELLRALCALHRYDTDGAARILLSALKRWPRDANLSRMLSECNKRSTQSATVASSESPAEPDGQR